MIEETKTASLRRLARIEGQVRGISRMVESDQYCIDIVRQIQAIKSALNGLESVIIDDHLATCVETALTSDNVHDRREKVEELVAVMGGRRK